LSTADRREGSEPHLPKSVRYETKAGQIFDFIQLHKSHQQMLKRVPVSSFLPCRVSGRCGEYAFLVGHFRHDCWIRERASFEVLPNKGISNDSNREDERVFRWAAGHEFPGVATALQGGWEKTQCSAAATTQRTLFVRRCAYKLD